MAAGIRSAIQDYEGQVSTEQGNRINQLTLVSIIFLPISFLTGYFGMNFQYLVNESMSFAAWFGLGVVLPVACVLASVLLLRRDSAGRFTPPDAPHVMCVTPCLTRGCEGTSS